MRVEPSADDVYRKVKSTIRSTSSKADPSVRPATTKRKPDRADPLGIGDSAAAAVKSKKKEADPAGDPDNAEIPRSSVFSRLGNHDVNSENKNDNSNNN